MKNKIATYILTATALFLTAGCADLEQSPQSSIDINEFYQTEEDLESALNGVYHLLSEEDMHGIYNDELIFLNDLQSEYARRGTANSADIAEIGNFAITPTNAFVESAWRIHYTGINRANILIDKAEENETIAEDTRLVYINQAKFLRALLYFNLVRYYGDVPLVLHDGEGEGEPRTSSDEVYQQIVEDLTAAENIPEGYSTLSSIASSGAASSLLALVYITWAQADTEYSLEHQDELYSKAVTYADKVNGKYSLNTNFGDNWALDERYDNSELIFTVEHKFGVNRNVTGHCTFSTGFTNDKLPVIAALDNSLYDETYDPNDQRRDVTVTKRLYDPFTDSYFDFDRIRFRKYIDTVYMANYSAPYISGQNISSSVLRYADVLLIKAEAENELNGPTAAAYAALNEVRKRAYWNPSTNTQLQPTDGTSLELSGLNQEEFREAVRDERFKEFILEGVRWFDLKRWHILVKTIKEKVPSDDLKYQNISTKHYFLPIPSDQITLNPNLEQNWGYGSDTTNDPYTAKGWE